MAEETTSQATESAASTEQAANGENHQAPTQEPAALDQTIDVDGEAEGQSVEFEPLFDTEDISDADLRGDDETTDDPETDPKSEAKDKSASSPPSDKKGAEKKASEDEGKPADTKADEAHEADGKPPKGFVSIGALHEERGKRQALSQEVQSLRSELQAFNTGKKQPETDGEETDQEDGEEFKVLSEAEFDELLEDDPVEAIKYDRKLRIHEAKQAEKEQAVKAEESIINQSIGMMADAIPGLYDEDSDVNQKLSDFAVEKGFVDLDGLALVTDPRTRIVPPNGGKPQLLGNTAANLVVMLNNLFAEVATPKSDAEKETALREKIKAEVTKELLGKIKLSPGSEHKSIADIPGAGNDDGVNMAGVMTEAQFAKLSESDQRRLLGG